MMELGISYFYDIYNLFELTQFVLFMFYVTIKLSIDFDDNSLIHMTILIVLVCQSFMKVMFFVRVFKKYGFLVTMLGFTFVDVLPFQMFFFMFIMFFSMIVMILRVQISSKFYPEVMIEFQYML